MLETPYDSRRNLLIGDSTEDAIHIATEHWLAQAKDAIDRRGRFAVALSGGSTPNAIYQRLSKASKALDWSKVFLFWGDERAVPSTHPDSNFHAAMQSGLALLPIPSHQIFRMQAEKKPIEEAAADYEALIQTHLKATLFDLVMLGVGEDGHTASLFPNTEALTVKDRLVVGNWVPQKNTWRMTLTYPCIQKSQAITFYALGASKESIVSEVLRASFNSSPYPASLIGSDETKALWILDRAAAGKLAV